MPPQRNNIIFICTLSIFLLVKSALLLLGMEHFFHVEEIYRALIAKSIIDGPSFPLLDLQVDTYSGGSLVVGLLLVPAFTIFGQSLFGIKFVALFFSFLIVAALYVFCKKYFDEKTAVIACLLFTFAPPLVTKYFFFCMGFHVESVLFSLLFMIVLFKIFFEERRGAPAFILLGFISGFGIWFTYAFAITLLAGLVFWYAADRLFFFRKRFLVFIAGFLFGFSPWIYSHFFYQLGGAPLNTRKLLPAFSPDTLRAAGAKLAGLPAAVGNVYLFNDHLGPAYRAANYLYCLFGAAAILYLVARNRKQIADFLRTLLFGGKHARAPSLRPWAELFPLVYLFIFTAAYALSGFAATDFMEYFGYRYLVPLYFFLILVMALCCARIRNGKAGVALATLLLCTGIAGSLQYADFKKSTFDLHAMDDQYCMYESLTNKKIARDAAAGQVDRCLEYSKTLDRKYLGQFFLGLGELTGWLFIKTPERYRALHDQVDEKFRALFVTGAAKAVILMHGDVGKSIAFIEAASPQHRLKLYSMLGISIGFRNTKTPEKAFALIDMIEQQYRPAVYEGFGYFLGFCAPLHRPDMSGCIKIFDGAGAEYKDSFGLSFGSLQRYFIFNRYNMNECLRLVRESPEAYKPHLYRALGAHYMRDRSGHGDCRTVVACIEQPYLPFFYEGMGFGIPDDQWLFSGLVAKRINRVYFPDTASRAAFCNGLEKALGLQTAFALDGEQQKRLLQREGIQSG